MCAREINCATSREKTLWPPRWTSRINATCIAWLIKNSFHVICQIFNNFCENVGSKISYYPKLQLRPINLPDACLIKNKRNFSNALVFSNAMPKLSMWERLCWQVLLVTWPPGLAWLNYTTYKISCRHKWQYGIWILRHWTFLCCPQGSYGCQISCLDRWRLQNKCRFQYWQW